MSGGGFRHAGSILLVVGALVVLGAAAVETIGHAAVARAGGDPAGLSDAERWLPFDADVRLRRAVALGRVEGRASNAALAAAEEGLRLRPRDANLLVLVGQAKGALGDDAGAERAFLEAVRVSDYDKGPAIVGATDRLDAAREFAARAARASEEAERFAESGAAQAAKERKSDAEELKSRAVRAAKAAIVIPETLHPDAWGFYDALAVAEEARRVLADIESSR